MISYAKAKRNVPKNTKITLKVASFESGVSAAATENILPMKKAVFAVNFNCSNGSLKNGIGFSPFSCDFLLNEEKEQYVNNIKQIGQVIRAWHFKKLDENGKRVDKLVMLNHEKKLFAISLAGDSTEVVDLCVQFTSIPVAVNYNLDSTDVMILCSPTDVMVVWNGENEPYSVSDAPAITSMVVHFERLFATSSGVNQNSVWFSDDLDPTNWTLSLEEAGFVQMVDERGASNKVVSFLDYVYVFRDFGISRISGYGDQTGFSISQLFTTNGRIFPNTVTLCGDEILFLAEDGVYSFNGLETKKILLEIAPFFEKIQNNLAQAVTCNGKWYLSCQMKFFEYNTAPKNVLLEIDLKTREISVCEGPSILHLASFNLEKESFVLACVENEEKSSVVKIDSSGKNQGEILIGKWVTPFSDLGMPSKNKVIRKIFVSSKKDLKLLIKSENEQKTFTFKGKSGVICKKTHVSGRKIQFALENENEDCLISNLQIELVCN